MSARKRSIALGVVLVSCGAGGVAPALAGSAAGQRTDAENHRAAIHDAQHLVQRVLLPARATPSSQEPGNDGGVLAAPAYTIGETNLIDEHAWWTVNEPMDEVFQYEKAHPPSGGKLTTTCSPSGGNQQPAQSCLGFSFPARRGVLGVRELVVEMVDLGNGTTGVRGDAEVQWIIVRPASEVVPAGVHAIHIVRPPPGNPISETVTDPKTVQRIIGLFDELPVLQPGVWACPPETGPSVRFGFRHSPHAPNLATAIVRAKVGGTNTGCDAMNFSIRGQPQDALVKARHFLRAVGHLLETRLTESPGH